MKIKYLHKI